MSRPFGELKWCVAGQARCALLREILSQVELSPVTHHQRLISVQRFVTPSKDVRGTTLLGSALQIPVLHSCKTDSNDFAF